MIESGFDVLHGFATTLGKVRQVNQDSYGFIKDDIYFVADGAGGLPGGDIASSIIRKSFPYYFSSNKKLELKKRFEKSVKQTHKEVIKYGITHPWIFGLCSTIAAVGFNDGNVLAGNVGDSRVYSVSNDEIKQISKDQAIFGYILTHAIGLRIGKPKISVFSGKPGDTFLLCTDGLIKMLSDEQVSSFASNKKISSNKDCEDLAKSLVDEADRLGGVDNTTVGIVKIL